MEIWNPLAAVAEFVSRIANGPAVEFRQEGYGADSTNVTSPAEEQVQAVPVIVHTALYGDREIRFDENGAPSGAYSLDGIPMAGAKLAAEMYAGGQRIQASAELVVQESAPAASEAAPEEPPMSRQELALRNGITPDKTHQTAWGQVYHLPGDPNNMWHGIKYNSNSDGSDGYGRFILKHGEFVEVDPGTYKHSGRSTTAESQRGIGSVASQDQVIQTYAILIDLQHRGALPPLPHLDLDPTNLAAWTQLEKVLGMLNGQLNVAANVVGGIEIPEQYLGYASPVEAASYLAPKMPGGDVENLILGYVRLSDPLHPGHNWYAPVDQFDLQAALERGLIDGNQARAMLTLLNVAPSFDQAGLTPADRAYMESQTGGKPYVPSEGTKLLKQIWTAATASESPGSGAVPGIGGLPEEARDAINDAVQDLRGAGVPERAIQQQVQAFVHNFQQSGGRQGASTVVYESGTKQYVNPDVTISAVQSNAHTGAEVTSQVSASSYDAWVTQGNCIVNIVTGEVQYAEG